MGLGSAAAWAGPPAGPAPSGDLLPALFPAADGACDGSPVTAEASARTPADIVIQLHCEGCCSYHDGVCCTGGVTQCCDGSPLSETCQGKGCTACFQCETAWTTTPTPWWTTPLTRAARPRPTTTRPMPTTRTRLPWSSFRGPLHRTPSPTLTRTERDLVTGVSRTTSYQYDPAGLLDFIDGPRTDVADITDVHYEGGLLQWIENALGQRTRFTDYDAHGRPRYRIDRNGVATELGYDSRGRYDAAGQITRVTLPDGSFLDYGYDDAIAWPASRTPAGHGSSTPA